MSNLYVNELSLKMFQRVKSELKEIERMSSMLQIKEKVSELLRFMDSETTDNREVLEEIIFQKVKETNGVNPDLHTQLYILYRNLSQNKIDTQEAKRLYESYIKNL